jgi:hypothetical protein
MNLNFFDFELNSFFVSVSFPNLGPACQCLAAPLLGVMCPTAARLHHARAAASRGPLLVSVPRRPDPPNLHLLPHSARVSDPPFPVTLDATRPRH